MSAYSQQTAKRQKVRDTKSDNEYFQGIDKLEYSNSAGPHDVSSYRFYSPTERVQNKLIEDWTKISVSLTDFRENGPSNYSHHTHTPWDEHTHTLDNHKRCLRALFEFCSKLGVKYWTAFDSDLVPWTDSWEEYRAGWDEMLQYVGELGQRYHVKLLWMAPDLHSHPRYISGAFTSNDATTFSLAATQIKKCLEMSQRMNAECFLLWPCREGYEDIFRSDVHKEIKLFAKLLKMTADYKERLNYRCQLLLMPCRSVAQTLPRYMWDVTSCLYLLNTHCLDKWYKVCAPPGHHMYMANVYGMLGGVTMSAEVDHYDNKLLTLMMKCILDQGAAPPGGISLELSPRRGLDLRGRLTLYMKYVDAIARALRYAAVLATEQMFAKHLQQKYASYQSGFGARILTNDVSMDECEEYYKKNSSAHSEVSSYKCEHMDLAFQRYIDTSDHI